MTVGLALVCESKRAIVLVADRAVTDEDDSTYEGQENKKREIGYGWHFVFEGGFSLANWVVEQVRELLRADDKTWRSHPMTAAAMKRYVAEAVIDIRRAEARREGVRFGTYELEVGLLVAGFDERNKSYVFNVDGFGAVEDAVANGHSEIGSGEIAARQRLVWLKPHKTDALSRTLYNALDAKRHAETNTAVGHKTDMWVLTEHIQGQGAHLPKGRMQPVRVNAHVRWVINRAFRRYTSSPFEVKPPPRPPGGWRTELQNYADAVMRGERPT